MRLRARYFFNATNQRGQRVERVCGQSMAPPKKAAASVTIPRVLVLQIDTRDATDNVHGPMRIWPGGSCHADQHREYAAANPPAPQRPYWALTPIANAWMCSNRGWTYRYQHVDCPAGRHPSWCKLRYLLDAWGTWGAESSTEPATVIMVLDTDAWIRDDEALAHLIDTHIAKFKCLGVADPPGREVAMHGADCLNGGFLCFVPDPDVKTFLECVWALPEHPTADAGVYKTEWPWEQACFGRAYAADIAGCQRWLHVLPPTTCNTPAGSHVAHCWYKDLATPLVIDDLLTAMARRVLAVPPPSLEFVIAKYDEDISWIERWLPYVTRVTVYDKSSHPADIPPASIESQPPAGQPPESLGQPPESRAVSYHPKVRVVRMPNVGREAHTYAHHFAEHHGDLCDTVVCTQGRYADHMSDAAFDAMVRTRTRDPGQGLVHGLDVAWTKSVMQHFGWTPERNHAPQLMQPMGMTMAKYYLTYVAADLVPEATVSWWMGAIFAVTAADVRRHPPATYAAIRHTLSHSSNPEAAHAMERFWKALLQP